MNPRDGNRHPPKSAQTRWLTNQPGRLRRLLWCLVLSLAPGVAAAAARITSLPPPPSDKITFHIVSAGETLFAIAWRYELAVDTLAAANRLAPPYRLRPGQRLTLASAASAAGPRPQPRIRTPPPISPRVPSSALPSTPGAPLLGTPRPACAGRAAPAPVTIGASPWTWPAVGTVTRKFAAERLFKGIDIKGRAGGPVTAAAAGTVVYAGTGVAGLGQLIIVRHDANYLSAYAHNRRMLVAEGAQVKAGFQIAEIGGDPLNPDRLYFEIRRDGTPIDPLLVLPRDAP